VETHAFTLTSTRDPFTNFNYFHKELKSTAVNECKGKGLFKA
jgi:hypothetical protein